MGNLRAYTEGCWEPENIPYKVYLPKQPQILTRTWPPRTMQCTGVDRTIWSMALFGECFWYILERGKGAYPTCLDILHPAFMEVKTDKATGEPIYIYGSGKDKRVLDTNDVVYIPFKSLPQAKRALSPVEYASVAGALAMAAYEFGSTWFSQGASPDFILSTDQKLGNEEVKRIAQKFVIEHGGLSASHMPLILDGGMKADKVMASPDEAQYLNSLEYSRSVIASWFGIPAEWLGNALQRLTPPPAGSLQESTMLFVQNTLSGYLVPIEEAFSLLLPDGQFAAFSEEKLTRPNVQMLSAEIMSLRNTQTASVNDTRVRLKGWAPVPGGDDVMAPLASNVSPAQTGNNDPPPAAKAAVKPKPKPVAPAGKAATTVTKGK